MHLLQNMLYYTIYDILYASILNSAFFRGSIHLWKCATVPRLVRDCATPRQMHRQSDAFHQPSSWERSKAVPYLKVWSRWIKVLLVPHQSSKALLMLKVWFSGCPPSSFSVLAEPKWCHDQKRHGAEHNDCECKLKSWSLKKEAKIKKKSNVF